MPEHYPKNWIEKLCWLLGIPYGWIAEDLFDAWGRAEGGTAAFNPLNTTYGLPGASLYNTDGVRNYAGPVDGICATALTLVGSSYAGILGDLQGGKLTPVEIVTRNAAGFDTWGTGAKNLLAVLQA